MSIRISVIGTGYLGATHAAAMAELGYEVIGVEVNPERLASLSQGHLPFYEPGLDEVLLANVRNGRLRFTSDAAEAAAWADVQFLCVGTPQVAGSDAADMSYAFAAIEALAPHIKQGALLVGKSTVPVGTTHELQRRLLEIAPDRTDVRFAWNPEFLREGFALEDTLHPDRIVIGVSDEADADTLRQVYAPMITEGIPLIVTDVTTAELVKVAANSFLATKISFINAMAEVCEAAGGDVTTLAEAIGHDVRIGSRFLGAGVGFGGGCLPKDIRAFAHRAGEIGAGPAVAFLKEVDLINLRRRERIIELVETEIGSVTGRRIAVLGATFKPDSDDVRDSPALAVSRRLHELGAIVTVHDPKGVENAERALPDVAYTTVVTEALSGAEAVLHLTEWREYRALEPKDVLPLVANPFIVDGRNVLDVALWQNQGWTVRAPGRTL
ncbi:UDP-glucose/GDP-mannose dehydrogenase family protein [Microcella daejeonensis]|uniref:UDP-glucose dehydrogenase family protein n=1 Tax=Microcella daejeonensis TaxID=2994971 RepID=UPI00226E1349|nr:UDP-glucose/GDP-mannose dehydrogenase family protein [Microcella daejeonensis]WAB84020.1 UDP-glucose/GDP-mannose dehydrogenase family protein [Microcella daejeonensis]